MPCRGLGKAEGRFPRPRAASWCCGSFPPQLRGEELALSSCGWLHSRSMKRRCNGAGIPAGFPNWAWFLNS